MKPIYFKQNVVCHLRQNETIALEKVAPYWGLWFEKETLMLVPALSSKTVSVTNMGENEREQLNQMLAHTGVHLVGEPSADLVLEVHKNNHRKHIPVTLTTENQVKYHLKYAKQPEKNLQQTIHKNVWLPVRRPYFSLTFHDMSDKNRHEVITYLVIQFFLRERMTPISDLSPELYATIVDNVLAPINVNFSSTQKPITEQVWPEIPPEISESNRSSPTVPKFDPFQRQNPTFQKTFDPFPPHKTINRTTINPFKRKT